MTKRVFQLDTVLANQIAAGEVVERPASVVKECIENSLDAGATKVEVEIEGGGMHLIRVRDNGTGIVKEDLALAFSRHATSKIHTAEDLTDLSSLGFRGEALGSIASVSRCRLVSKALDAPNAAQIQFDINLQASVSVASHLPGTTIEVADLFYNVPARRKFLRSERTEFQWIDEVVKRLALANPHVSFTLKHDQRLIRSYVNRSESSSERKQLAKMCGEAFAQHAKKVSIEAVGLSLSGWLGAPDMARRQADCQYFFVNQRVVKDRIVNHVIKTVYAAQASMVEGSYPCFVLFLTLDPKEVDVNVHPTKQEVRFAQPRLIHDFIRKAVMSVFESVPSMDVEPRHVPDSASSKRFAVEGNTNALPLPVAHASESSACVLGKRYAVFEEAQGVVLVDYHRAMSWLLKDYLHQHWGNVQTRRLLFPPRMSFSFPAHTFERLEAMLANSGILLHYSNSEVTLLEQPHLLLTPLSGHTLEKLILAAKQSNPKEAIIDSLSTHAPPQIAFSELSFSLNAQNRHQPGIVRLSHDELQRLGTLKTPA